MANDLTASRPPITQQVTFLYVTDLEATHRFYNDLLGLPLVLDQGTCRIYRAAGEAFLGFCRRGAALQPPEIDATPHTGTPRDTVILTLVSDDVDEWGAYLQSAGVPIEKPPRLNPTFNIYHLFVRDPDQRLVEIQRFLDPAWPAPATQNPLP